MAEIPKPLTKDQIRKILQDGAKSTKALKERLDRMATLTAAERNLVLR